VCSRCPAREPRGSTPHSLSGQAMKRSRPASCTSGAGTACSLAAGGPGWGRSPPRRTFCSSRIVHRQAEKKTLAERAALALRARPPAVLGAGPRPVSVMGGRVVLQAGNKSENRRGNRPNRQRLLTNGFAAVGAGLGGGEGPRTPLIGAVLLHEVLGGSCSRDYGTAGQKKRPIPGPHLITSSGCATFSQTGPGGFFHRASTSAPWRFGRPRGASEVAREKTRPH